jgi:hypothetical protein
VTETYEDTQSTTVTNAITITSSTASITLEGCTSIHLHCGDSQLCMNSTGEILLSGKLVQIVGSDMVQIMGNQIVSSATTNHDTIGAAITSQASGNNIVKGAMGQLNP